MIISCFANDVHLGLHLYPRRNALGAKILNKAIEEARAKNFLGKNILGKGYDWRFTFIAARARTSAARKPASSNRSKASGLIRASSRRIFPAVLGLFGCARPSSTTSRRCGPVKRPGYYEFEMGKLTMRQLIYDLCGGLQEGRQLKGVIPGGSSMPVLKADQIDVALDFESLRKAGTMAGSGGVIVLDDTVDIVKSTLNVAQFYAHESCGQCTPCREGTLWMEKMLHRIKHGHGRPEDVDLLWDVADNIDGKTICPLGEAAAWPVKAFVTKYRGEFDEQGVAMLSSVLRSPRAVKVNIEIMRAFVRLRQLMATHTDLARKLEELEKKYDSQFRVVFEVIRELMTEPEPPRKEIGFHARERRAAYRVGRNGR
jgi:NADH-quinone oxidoreductase subunit F